LFNGIVETSRVQAVDRSFRSSRARTLLGPVVPEVGTVRGYRSASRRSSVSTAVRVAAMVDVEYVDDLRGVVDAIVG
jgi:hypothetical protein